MQLAAIRQLLAWSPGAIQHYCRSISRDALAFEHVVDLGSRRNTKRAKDGRVEIGGSGRLGRLVAGMLGGRGLGRDGVGGRRRGWGISARIRGRCSSALRR